MTLPDRRQFLRHSLTLGAGLALAGCLPRLTAADAKTTKARRKASSRSVGAKTSNWVAIEQRGLFTIGTIFPEFTESATWRSLAVTRLEALLANDFYPDGASVEL